MNKHEAVYMSYPEVRTIVGDIAFDSEGVQVHTEMEVIKKAEEELFTKQAIEDRIIVIRLAMNAIDEKRLRYLAEDDREQLNALNAQIRLLREEIRGLINGNN